MSKSQLTKQNKRKILDFLWTILDTNTSCVRDRRSGLCTHVEDLFDYASCSQFYGAKDYLSSLFVKWPEYSGMPGFPVPAITPSRGPANEYFCTDDLWVGAYGESRIRLVMFLIEQISKDVGIM